MYVNESEKRKDLYEKNKYEDMAFPVGIYTITKEKIIPEGRGYLDMHWHEELQFTVVIEGYVAMQVNGKVYMLQKGEAIFINRNLLHMTSEISDDGKYISINFPGKLLGFFAGSRMEQDYVLPYTDNYLFPVIVLKKDNSWQYEILEILQEILQMFLGKQEMFEYQISMKLVTVWYTLISNMEEKLTKPNNSYVRRVERIQKMLTFIHEHYAENILLKDIAAEANVSEGECCRCFKAMISESPNQYLLKYRISRSMELLNSTDLSVTDIALRCGFNDASHYIQYFKKRVQMTPYEYRSRKC